MSTMFEEGGWGMYPTTVLGLVLTAMSVWFGFRPERRFLPPMLALVGLTLASGVLGFLTGLSNTLRYVASAEPDERAVSFAVGCAESLLNVTLAVGLILFAGLFALIGLVRNARRAVNSQS